MDANRRIARVVAAAALAGAGCGGERFSGAGDGDGGGGPYPTEVAVENGSAAPISVTLASTDGDEEPFADVAPGTATEMREVDWASLDGVTVTVDVGSAQGGTIALVAERENLVQLSDAAPPALEVSAPPVSGGAGGASGW